jgi:hypothetical protein
MKSEIIATKNNLNLLFDSGGKTGIRSYSAILKLVAEKDMLPIEVKVNPDPTICSTPDNLLDNTLPIIRRLNNVGRKFEIVTKSETNATTTPMQCTIWLYPAYGKTPTLKQATAMFDALDNQRPSEDEKRDIRETCAFINGEL